MGLLDFMLGIKKKKIKSFLSEDALLLDLRDKNELAKGKIEDSLHIPLSELNQELDKIKAYDRPVIAYCESGVRSAKAVKILKLKKIKAINGGSWKFIKKLIHTN